MTTDKQLKKIRSFVMRQGRMTEGQQRGMDEVYPRLGLDPEATFNSQQIFGNDHPLVIEIGFGMGDSLLQMAMMEPNCNFIGIEVHPPGVGRLLNNADKTGVSNLRVYKDDAVEVLKHCFADNSIDRLQLFFPDPWHKKKHHKRRIVQADFANLVHHKLKPEGVWHLATDWQPYAEQMLEVLTATKGFTNTAGDGQYSERPVYRPETKFERRGVRLGHGVWDLIFKKAEIE
ncbi:tRNA (guanosine(46)-N7)-methyltransferase TrmB [Gynuella sunshinyii]|uniref:tRNA (guanine-N(7)-)-methyltransferase n=1 Tax=Gynuella sunshinyii YC6258 TaxID=1445510 RepID=A0A0C5VJI2_9GAMM|nr:tRNA (guanosine(46)-N7)-methyltransferase TrmB [Gynuella sunshinyii]AJQ93558.1 putative S-adenosylmethionine-dependent methyltransferase [Gynuella sunshinyii YC6258]